MPHVKDPDGRQSPPCDFGFSQRDAGDEDTKWKDKDDNGKYKVIPYFNKTKPKGKDDAPHKYKVDDPVEYEKRLAQVYLDDELLGDIWIAIVPEKP